LKRNILPGASGPERAVIFYIIVTAAAIIASIALLYGMISASFPTFSQSGEKTLSGNSPGGSGGRTVLPEPDQSDLTATQPSTPPQPTTPAQPEEEKYSFSDTQFADILAELFPDLFPDGAKIAFTAPDTVSLEAVCSRDELLKLGNIADSPLLVTFLRLSPKSLDVKVSARVYQDKSGSLSAETLSASVEDVDITKFIPDSAELLLAKALRSLVPEGKTLSEFEINDGSVHLVFTD